MVSVPATGDPAELQRLARLRPEGVQPGVVTRQLPVSVQLHEAAHLTIGGGDAAIPCFRRVQGQSGTESHPALIISRIQKFHLAHGAREIAKQKGSRLFVIPDMGTGTMAAAGIIAAAFPAKEMTVCSAKTGLRA